MAEQKQKVEIKGDSNQVFAAQRDLHIHRTEAQEFLQIKPETLTPTPVDTDRLVDLLVDQHFLVLGGILDIDKSKFAQHLAYCLKEKLVISASADGQPEPKNGGTENSKNEIEVWEWYPTSNPQNPIAGLQKIEKTAIVILPDVSPQHVNYQDLAQAQASIAQKGHYAILTTDKPREAWKIDGNGDVKFWPKLSDRIYSPLDLAPILGVKWNIAKHQEKLPPDLLCLDFNPNQLLVTGWTLGKVAVKLKTPENMDRFINLLCNEKRRLTPVIVEELVERSRDQVWHWYPRLNSREQLLALGLSFFDGLFEDQFFAAIERVVEQVWQRRDSSLRALDHCDLESLADFFSFVKTDQGEIVKSNLSEQRRNLFARAWHSHRRQILSAMPVIVDLIKESVVEPPRDLELFGTAERCDRLRQVTGDALSEIGLNSPDAIRYVLIVLAADENIEVQAVTARAMARWYDTSRRDDMLKILDTWELNLRILDIINAYLEGRDLTKSKGPRAYVRATIALTISYVAVIYTVPNQLPEELRGWIKRLAADENEFVRDRFTSHTLPAIIPIHLTQLQQEGILRELVAYLALIPSVSASLALAYERSPQEVQNILSSWRKECLDERPKHIDTWEITIHEALLATVALTYGRIPYDVDNSVISARQAFRELRELLNKEKHPFVRRAIVIAVTLLASRHFEEVEAQLKSLVTKITAEEQQQIVQTLTEVYRDQREKLEGGDDVLRIGNRSYQIWIDSDRPKTPIELAILQWLTDSENNAAQQIAIMASVSFAKALDKAESDHIEALRKAREGEKEEEEKDAPEPALAKTPKHGWFVDRFIPWFITIRRRAYQSVIRGLLPEALLQHNAGRDIMDFVLSKWEKQAPDDEIKLVVQLLTRAIHLAESRRKVYLLALVGALGIVLLAVFVTYLFLSL